MKAAKLLVISVLIVPYGIETAYSLSFRYTVFVLIVPYGIETISQHRIF